MVDGIESFGDNMEGVEYFDLFRDVTWDECRDIDYQSFEDAAAAQGIDLDIPPFDKAYVWGCTIPGDQSDIATYGPFEEGTFPDTETRRFFTETACAVPFRSASEADWEWHILRSGICFYIDFTPSDVQLESGMVPCP
jgi:hypothetical protein